MKMKKLPPVETLREMLSYDPESGEFRWKIKPSQCVNVGDIAGCTVGGYRKIKIKGNLFAAHRIAWAIHYGEDPYPQLVDHKQGKENGDGIDNLRLATVSENTYNSVINLRNTSGHRGVSKYKHKWRAKLGDAYLGCFNSVEDAINARLKAEADNNIYICDR